MEGAIVFVFLLDNLPGFDVTLNKTLQDTLAETRLIQPKMHLPTPKLQHCRTIVLTPVLMTLHKVIRSTLHINTPSYKDMSPEKLYNLGTVFDNSLPDYEREGSLEMQENNLESDNEPNGVEDRTANHAETSIDNTIVLTNESKVLLPKRAPFVAAIFESLSNITAQTCAGALVSRDWVLTAASCINLLGELYGNMTVPLSKSHYTVVINSTNPLIDGTIHNVTTILMNPVDKTSHDHDDTLDPSYPTRNPSDLVNNTLVTLVSRQNVSNYKEAKGSQDNPPASNQNPPNLTPKLSAIHKPFDPIHMLSELHRMLSGHLHKLSDPLYYEEKPNLALMRIEPPVVGLVGVVLDDVGVGGDVRVYGWMLDKNPTERSMHPCFLPAQTSPCQEKINTGLCLSMTNDTADEINELSSGGPVLTMHNDKVTLIGVAQTDVRAINVYPVAVHHTWIQNVLNSKW